MRDVITTNDVGTQLNWKEPRNSLIEDSRQLQNRDLACVFDGVGMGPAVEKALKDIRKNVKQLESEGRRPSREDCTAQFQSGEEQQRCKEREALKRILGALATLDNQLDCTHETPTRTTHVDDEDQELCPGLGTVKEIRTEIRRFVDKIGVAGDGGSPPKTGEFLDGLVRQLKKRNPMDVTGKTEQWCDLMDNLTDSIDAVNAACTGDQYAKSMDEFVAAIGDMCAELTDWVRPQCEAMARNKTFFKDFQEVADPRKRHKQWEHIDEKFKENYEYCR